LRLALHKKQCWHQWVGIGIEETNVGIGIPASKISGQF
jgi:hypothetical protein